METIRLNERVQQMLNFFLEERCKFTCAKDLGNYANALLDELVQSGQATPEILGKIHDQHRKYYLGLNREL
jgi:hypothetical protein